MISMGSQSVLVTGANGFIGTELSRQLQAAGHPLTLLMRPGGTSPCVAGDPDLTLLYGELTDPAVAARACNGIDTVYHLAGRAHTVDQDPDALRRSHVETTRVLLQQARAQGVRRLIYFSSSLAAEQASASDTDAYAAAKREAESLVREAQAQGHLETVILRPVNVYGIGMRGNIRRLMERVAAGKAPPLPKLATRLSLVGVADLCRAARLAGESRKAVGNCYTVTDGEVYRIDEIEAAIYAALGRKKPGWHTPRVLVYAAAVAGLGGLSLKAYRNLVTDNLHSHRELADALGFHPSSTLYAELPAIVADLR